MESLDYIKDLQNQGYLSNQNAVSRPSYVYLREAYNMTSENVNTLFNQGTLCFHTSVHNTTAMSHCKAL